MPEFEAQRTLVKSPPELWAELSEVERLAKHLGAFGEIKITKLDPEHTVAWESEHASGTVSMEPSGWGTKVTLTAELVPEAEDELDETPAPPATTAEVEEPEPRLEVTAPANPPTPEPPPTEDPPRRRRGFWARLFSGWLVPQERPRDGRVEPPVLGQREVVAHAPALKEPEPVAPAAPAPDDDASHGGRDSVDPESPEEEPATESNDAFDAQRARSVLDQTLDALGSAHHRPFSRG